MLFKPIKRRNNSLSIGGGREIEFTDPAIVDFLHAKDYTSADKALENSDLYSVINQISADIATSHFTASMKRTQALIDNPSSTTNPHAFWQSVVAQLLLDGNSYAYMWRNINGQVVRLEYLRPSQVSAFLLDDGSGLVYNITFDEPKIGVVQNVPQGDLLHFRLLSTSGGMIGRSPLLSLQNELNIKNSSNGLTLQALGKAIVPNGVLHIKGAGLLSTEEKIAQSEGFQKQANSSAGPVILDDLSEYTPLEIKSDVSKLLASTDWTSKQVAKVYGISDSYLNGTGDQQSSINMVEGVYANSLNRYARVIQSEMSSKFSADIQVDVSPAIDQDQSSYIGVLANAVKGGMVTPEQANYLLHKKGFLTDDVPLFQKSDVTTSTLKGGENNGSNSN